MPEKSKRAQRIDPKELIRLARVLRERAEVDRRVSEQLRERARGCEAREQKIHGRYEKDKTRLWRLIWALMALAAALAGTRLLPG